ncbi:MAG: TonB-dependent receptor [bacterium]|nr:TonB-dependent receptor [bacterium]
MKRFTLLICILIVSSSIANAEAGTGSISGIVVDGVSKAPLNGALVAIKGTSSYATSDDSGYFVISDVPAGRAVLDVARIGYKKQSLTDIIVLPGRRTTANVGLTASLIEGEVRITAEDTDYFTTKSDITVSDHSMSNEEIRRQPGGAGDIQRVISSLPGVGMISDNTSDLIVRGGDPDENLVLLDDIEILSAAHYAQENGAHGVISVLNLEVVDNVEFIAGGFPAEYGGKRSSVMQLELSEGSRESLSGSGYFNMAGLGAILEGPIGKGNGSQAPGSYIGTARFSFLDLLSKITDFGVGTAVPRYWDTNAKLAYRLSPKHKLTFTGFYAADTIHIQAEEKDEDDFNIDWYGQMDAEGITHEWIHSTKGTLRTTLYRSANAWDYDSQLGGFGTDTNQEEYAVKSRFAYMVSPHLTLVTGGHGRYYTATYDSYMYSQYDDTGDPINESHEIGEEKAYRGGAYAEGIVKPAEWVTLTLGGRADYLDFNDDLNLSPRGSLRFQITDKLALNAAAGRYYQPPSAPELVSSKEDNPNNIISAGYADHYIGGATYLVAPDTEVGVEGYYKLLKDLPVTALDEGDYVTLNSGDGDVKGGEIYLHKKLSGSLFVRATYSYSVAEKRRRLGDEYRPSAYDRTHISNFIVGYEPWKDWMFSSKVSYATGRPYTPIVGRFRNPDTGEYYAEEGELMSLRMPATYKLDLRFDKRFNFKNWSITTYFDCQNITNHQNVIGYSWNYDYSRRLTESSWGIMPVGGFEAAF